jgi:hypothetical protein
MGGAEVGEIPFVSRALRLLEATMSKRSGWIGVLAVAVVFVLLTGGRGAVDAQGEPDPRPGDFVQAGRFTINKSRIDYVERSERGQLYVYFTSKNSIVLTGDASKALLHALGTDDAARPQ